MGIETEDVTDRFFTKRRGGHPLFTSRSFDFGRHRGDDDQLIGFFGWHRLAWCETGYAMVDFDTLCRVRRVYTRGACTLQPSTESTPTPTTTP